MRIPSGIFAKPAFGSALHHAAILACLVLLWYAATRDLTTVPLANHDELRTLSHIFGHSIHTPLPLHDTVSNVAANSQQHGPLYFVLLNIWSRVAGSDLFVLRLLSAFAALLSLAAIYRLAAITRQRNLALAAMFIVAINALFLFYARELRMYTLLPCLAAGIAWRYWRLLEATEGIDWRDWLWLAVACALILYLHYFGIFMLAAVALYHLIFARRQRRWLPIALALGAGGLLFLPWLPTVVRGLAGFSSKSFVGMSALEALFSIANVYSNDLWMLPLGAAIALAWRRQRCSKPQVYLLLLACLAIAVMLLANEIKPVLIAKRLRYFLLLAPLLGSALAIAWQVLPRRAPLQLLLALVWVFSLYAYSQNDNSYIASKRKSQEALHAPPYYALAYHPQIAVLPTETVLSLHPSRKITWITGDYYQKLIMPKNLVHIYYDGGGRLTLQTTKQPLQSLDDFVAKTATFWMLYDPQATDERSMGAIFGWARKFYRSCGKYREETAVVAERYVRDSDPC